MSKIKRYDGLPRVTKIPEGTTTGAILGVNLRDSSGRVLQASEVLNPPDDGTRPTASTIWRLIREIPANIVKLAALVGVGFTTRDGDGEWHQRTLQPGAGIDVQNGDGVAGDPSIALADLPNSGIGTAIYKTTRDAKGRTSGQVTANTDDLPESGTPTNQWFTAARVRAVVLTGLSTATNAAITAADTVLSALGKLQAQITGLGTSKADKATFTGYVTGLVMTWISGTSISVSTGSCYIPSLSYVLSFPSVVTKSSLSLSANTWYHVYAYLNVAIPDIEVVTTAPAAAYSGDARAKTGDTSRRYIGSIRTDASGNVLPFVHTGDSIKYTNNVINNIVLNAGNATTATTVDVSIYCPVTSRIADALCYNSASSASGAFVFFSNSEAIAVSSSTYLAASAPTAYLAVGLLMDSTQKITYIYNASPGGGGAFVRVMGYKFAR